MWSMHSISGLRTGECHIGKAIASVHSISSVVAQPRGAQAEGVAHGKPDYGMNTAQGSRHCACMVSARVCQPTRSLRHQR